MAFSKKMDKQQKQGPFSFNDFHFLNYYNTEIRFEFLLARPHLQVTANPKIPAEVLRGFPDKPLLTLRRYFTQ